MATVSATVIIDNELKQIERWRVIEQRSTVPFTQAEIQLINKTYNINYTSKGDVSLTLLAKTGNPSGTSTAPLVDISLQAISSKSLSLPKISIPLLTETALPNITLPSLPSTLNAEVNISVPTSFGNIGGSIGVNSVKGTEGNVSGSVQGAVGQVKGQIQGIIGGVTGTALGAVGAVQATIAGAASQIKGAINNALGVLSKIQGIISNVAALYTDGIAGGSLKSISSIFNSYKNKLRTSIGGVEAFVGTGQGSGVDLKALINLSKTPTCTGVPGGFVALSIRLGKSDAQQLVENALLQINTSTPDKAADAAKAMTPAQQSTAGKGGGCGGRRARAESIYSGSKPMSVATIIYWEQKVADLKKVGIVESDSLPPTNVNMKDWQTVVEGYMPVIETNDAKNAAITQISQSLSL